MIKDLELLLKLQKVDDAVGELERSKVYLPEMIEELEGALEDAEKALANNEEQLTADKLEQRRLEGVIEDARSKIDRLTEQMSAVKTNREYDAISRETTHIKEKVSADEDTLLTVMGQIEELQEEHPKLEERRKDLSKNSASQLKELREQMSALQDKIAEKMKARKTVAEQVDRRWLGTYDRIRRRFESSVVPVKKRACSGCFTAIPPQMVQILKRADRLVTCESCGRILYWDSDEE
jgi:predicted  nucleic acid-binding Zn-ribbon protein